MCMHVLSFANRFHPKGESEFIVDKFYETKVNETSQIKNTRYVASKQYAKT